MMATTQSFDEDGVADVTGMVKENLLRRQTRILPRTFKIQDEMEEVKRKDEQSQFKRSFIPPVLDPILDQSTISSRPSHQSSSRMNMVVEGVSESHSSFIQD